jgi:hypothetical protein
MIQGLKNENETDSHVPILIFMLMNLMVFKFLGSSKVQEIKHHIHAKKSCILVFSAVCADRFTKLMLKRYKSVKYKVEPVELHHRQLAVPTLFSTPILALVEANGSLEVAHPVFFPPFMGNRSSPLFVCLFVFW